MKRMSKKEFNRFYSAIWQRGPQVRYQNPDAWLNVHTPKRLF
jgi:hypothetical protein